MPALEPVLFVPDTHAPNHDKKAWALMLRAAKALKPKHIVILGDFADGETLSSHAPTKPGVRDFEDELESVRRCLTELDSLGATNKIYVSGNHEFRLDRFLMEKAPSLFRSVKWQTLLGLHERGWKWVPYRKSTRLGKLHLTHDTGSAGMNAHRSAAADFGGSVVIGHTHRCELSIRGRFDGKPYVAAMFGWLGDREAAGDYMHEAKTASTWCTAFGVGYLNPANGVVHLQPIPIIDGTCVLNGKLYR